MTTISAALRGQLAGLFLAFTMSHPHIVSKISAFVHSFFDTICGATSKRQEEAHPAGRNSAALMVVIGDGKSSNTRTSGGALPRESVRIVRLIERAADLEPSALSQAECGRHHGGRLHACVDNKGGL